MEENKFFQWVWRVNAIIIVLVFTMVLMVGIAVIHDEIISPMMNNDTAIVKTAEPGQIGNFKRICGTPYLMARFGSDISCSKSSFSKTEERGPGNFLFIDSDDLSIHWLFPDKEKQIVEAIDICEDCEDAGRCAAKGLLFVVRKLHKDADDGLRAADTTSVFVSDQSGRKVTEVVTGIDQILETHPVNPETVVLIFEKGGKRFAAKLSFSERRILDSKALPVIE